MHKKKALLTGHILISAHPSAEYCLSGRVVVSLLQAFTPLLRPAPSTQSEWMPYIGKVMLVRLFCCRNGSDWYEIMSLKTLKSNFYVHRSNRIIRIQPSSLAQVVRRDRCFQGSANRYGDWIEVVSISSTLYILRLSERRGISGRHFEQ